RAPALHRLAHQPLDVIVRGLETLRGIGPWTIAETLQRTHGAADLLSVGDFHLAHHIGEALTGRRTDDAGMLELLELCAGHSHSLVSLIYVSAMRFSRFEPRMAVSDFWDR